MAQQLDKISDATALIGALVTRSRAAQSVLGKSDFASRRVALQAAADQIRAQTAAILEVNAKDVATAKASGISGAFIDRLTLNDERVEAMATGLEAMTRLIDRLAMNWRAGNSQAGLILRGCQRRLG